MKPKAKTLAERYGFRDPDLKTPKHDDIILWLMDKGNMYDVITKTYGVVDVVEECRYRHKRDRSLCFCVFDDSGEKMVGYGGSDRRRVKKYDECPFKNIIEEEIKNLKNKIHELDYEKLKKYYLECIEIMAEHPVTSYKDYIIGFIDFVVHTNTPRNLLTDQKFIHIEQFGGHNIINIEVKTKIDNFGETMRQLNMYRKFIDGSMILVVPTLSVELRKAFESQGIKVFTTQSDARELFV